jgi:membrane-associated HD superfamily phosphohydrolase
MRAFLQIVSYLLHPLYIPFAGTLAYFLITPKYSPLEVQSGNILPIFILTVIIPIIFYLILRNLSVISTVQLPDLKERKYPLYISLALLLMVVIRVIPNNFTIELHYYFLGLIAATFSALILLFLNFKCSLHLIAMGSLLMFLVNLSIHFEKNITIAIAVTTLLCGLVASSRLYLNNNNRAEVIIGLLIGIFTQLFTIKFWL